MRLGDRRTGSRTLFVDNSSEDVLLEVVSVEDGCSLVAFKLYDRHGDLVAEAPEPASFPAGISIRSLENELLLEIPPEKTEGCPTDCTDDRASSLLFQMAQGPWSMEACAWTEKQPVHPDPATTFRDEWRPHNDCSPSFHRSFSATGRTS